MSLLMFSRYWAYIRATVGLLTTCLLTTERL